MAVKHKIIFFFSFASSFCMNSCISIENEDTVLEKSSEVTPTWIDQSINIAADPTGETSLVYKKEPIKDLNLGIKQVQNYVNTRAENLLLDHLIEQEKNHANIITKTSLFENKDQKLIPKIKSLYWEKHKKEMSSFYVIWILFSLKNTDYKLRKTEKT